MPVPVSQVSTVGALVPRPAYSSRALSAANFDRLAPYYRWIERLTAGNLLQRCRVAWLDQVRHCQSALLVGEGAGNFLSACAQHLPYLTITCLDSSRAMLDLARQRWQRAGGDTERVDFVHASITDWPIPEERHDLVVTHFFLDCFTAERMPQVIERLALAAKNRATWLLADFAISGRGLAGLRARIIVDLLYRFFRIAAHLPATRLVAPDPFLQKHRFQLKRRRSLDWGLLHSDLWGR